MVAAVVVVGFLTGEMEVVDSQVEEVGFLIEEMIDFPEVKVEEEVLVANGEDRWCLIGRINFGIVSLILFFLFMTVLNFSFLYFHMYVLFLVIFSSIEKET